jgi:glutamate--cysteine ligase
VATAWDTAARVGLRDARLRTAAKKCVAAAAEKLPDTCGAQLSDSMRRLTALVEQGRCPGDDVADQVIEHGIAPTVARLAQGEM